MEYLTTVKMSKKWNISSRRIITLCIEGRKLNAEFGKGFSVDTLENMRKFYVIYQNRISEKLYRKFDSSLFERIALSADKEKVKQLSQKGQIVSSASDVVKDPYVLEFLGLEEKSIYSETELENRILNNLQKFLLENPTIGILLGSRVSS